MTGRTGTTLRFPPFKGQIKPAEKRLLRSKAMTTTHPPVVLNRPDADHIAKRLMAHIAVVGECWEWTGFRNPKGYGKLEVTGLGQMAHRISHLLFVGPIADGHTIDHLCRNRGCVNPAHLEAVPHRVNVLRGNTTAARHARQTHCKNGHALSGDNLHINPRGSRVCRTCEKAAGVRYRAKRKAQQQLANTMRDVLAVTR